MVAEFELAGYNAEAAVFAPQVNEQLETHQIPLRILLQAAATQPALDNECSQCSAILPLTSAGGNNECSYCGYIVKTSS